MRLPDTYYTNKNLDGYYEPPGQPSLAQFYQGETIVFDFYLFYHDAPVDLKDWNIEVVVKKSQKAINYMWQGTYQDGLYISNRVEIGRAHV